ncbi:hypothetical protein [Flagellimonas sp.]|uniref:hypothetical protein n=1 Tax=Flagellimonas sp. TaxID=2058762 RepID=UPI003AB4F5C7
MERPCNEKPGLLGHAQTLHRMIQARSVQPHTPTNNQGNLSVPPWDMEFISLLDQ